jgi:hypothetical protein
VERHLTFGYLLIQSVLGRAANIIIVRDDSAHRLPKHGEVLRTPLKIIMKSICPVTHQASNFCTLGLREVSELRDGLLQVGKR